MVSQKGGLCLLTVFFILCTCTSAFHSASSLNDLKRSPCSFDCKRQSGFSFLQLRQETLRVKGGGEEEDDVDLFGDDDDADTDAAAELKAKAAQNAQKAKKGDKPPAKTNMILDVKGWDDETDMAKIEELVRAIDMDGLTWGASALEDVGYGIKKLRITCVVEDEKVSIDDLEEKIKEHEDYVQSVDVAAMNKV